MHEAKQPYWIINPKMFQIQKLPYRFLDDNDPLLVASNLGKLVYDLTNLSVPLENLR